MPKPSDEMTLEQRLVAQLTAAMRQEEFRERQTQRIRERERELEDKRRKEEEERRKKEEERRKKEEERRRKEDERRRREDERRRKEEERRQREEKRREEEEARRRKEEDAELERLRQESAASFSLDDQLFSDLRSFFEHSAPTTQPGELPALSELTPAAIAALEAAVTATAASIPDTSAETAPPLPPIDDTDALTRSISAALAAATSQPLPPLPTLPDLPPLPLPGTSSTPAASSSTIAKPKAASQSKSSKKTSQPTKATAPAAPRASQPHQPQKATTADVDDLDQQIAALSNSLAGIPALDLNLDSVEADAETLKAVQSALLGTLSLSEPLPEPPRSLSHSVLRELPRDLPPLPKPAVVPPHLSTPLPTKSKDSEKAAKAKAAKATKTTRAASAAPVPGPSSSVAAPGPATPKSTPGSTIEPPSEPVKESSKTKKVPKPKAPKAPKPTKVVKAPKPVKAPKVTKPARSVSPAVASPSSGPVTPRGDASAASTPAPEAPASASASAAASATASAAPSAGPSTPTASTPRAPSRPRRPRNTALTEEDKDRIREENRARKKRWRDTHALRNKDNDLRARILRRAQQQFGEQESEAKTEWIDQEYQRRREKRLLRPTQGGVSKYSIPGSTSSTISSIAAAAGDVPRPAPVSRGAPQARGGPLSLQSIDNDMRPLSQQTRLAAGTQLSRLFRESNAILEHHNSHLHGTLSLPHAPLPSPARPGFVQTDKPDRASSPASPAHGGPLGLPPMATGASCSSQTEPISVLHKVSYKIRGAVSLGAPPDLAALLGRSGVPI